MASAAFTTNGGASPQTTTSGATVNLALTSVTGSGPIVWSIIGHSDSTKTTPTIVAAGSPLGATASFTMSTPTGTRGVSWIVQCRIQGGVDSTGAAVAAYTATAIVGVLNAAGILPFCTGETLERGTSGIADDVNAVFAGVQAYPFQPAGAAEVTFATTAGTADVTVFTVPASPTGNGRFLLFMALERLSTAIVGTGNVVLRVGTTVGGNEIVTDCSAITSAGTVGTVEGGQAISSLGASMAAANGYTALLNAGDIVRMRATTSGTLSAGKATCYVYGCFLT
jgi:hypothetical protein